MFIWSILNNTILTYQDLTDHVFVVFKCDLGIHVQSNQSNSRYNCIVFFIETAETLDQFMSQQISKKEHTVSLSRRYTLITSILTMRVQFYNT